MDCAERPNMKPQETPRQERHGEKDQKKGDDLLAKKAPTEEGYYWLSKGANPEIVYVAKIGDHFECLGIGKEPFEEFGGGLALVWPYRATGVKRVRRLKWFPIITKLSRSVKV